MKIMDLFLFWGRRSGDRRPGEVSQDETVSHDSERSELPQKPLQHSAARRNQKHDTEETVEAEDLGVVSPGKIRRKPRRLLWIVVQRNRGKTEILGCEAGLRLSRKIL
jgi:hypothetical protein